MRRFAFALLVFTAILSVSAICFAETVVISTSFENSGNYELWSGGNPDAGDSGHGEKVCYVNNPYGEEIEGRISHMLTFSGTVHFDAGAVYEISFMAKSLDGSCGRAASEVRFGDGKRNIVFEFWGITEEWSEASAFFIVPGDDEYGFSIELAGGSPDMGFAIDKLVIQKIDITSESLALIGATELTIPASGEISESYYLAAYTADGEVIRVLSDDAVITATDLPAGVKFDSETGTATVSDYCPEGASFVLECNPPEYLGLESFSTKVTLTRNILRNYDFSEGESYWSIEPEYELVDTGSGSRISLYTENSGKYGYSASMSPDYTPLLMGGVMYVLRAEVLVEAPEGDSVYSQNTAIAGDGEIEINILDLSAGGKTEVIAAFTPETDGIYDIKINFFTPEEGKINVSRITLAPEDPEPTYITLHAPGNISVPDTATVYPFNSYLRDQSGTILGSRCNLRLYPEDKGVELTSDGIKVSPDAVAGDYEIYAVARENSSIDCSLIFTVSGSNIGDGGFEEKKINEWWAAASPGVMTIEDTGDNKYGRITSDYDYAVVLNNSYMHLYAERTYVFKGSIIDGTDQTVTAFIEDTSGEKFPVVQFVSDSDAIFELFQVDSDIVGRLILYVSSESGSIDISLDNLELFRAVIGASAPVIEGTPEVGATLEAKFNFFSNLDSSLDSSDCAVTWYMSDASSDEAAWLGGGRSITVPDEAAGKYIYYELVPVCKLTGLSGDMLKSVTVLVGGEAAEQTDSDSDETSSEKPDTTQTVQTLSPVTLVEDGELPFDDTKGHWAEKYILPLYNAGVLKGRDDGNFHPEDKITRGELAAVIARAFGIYGGKHDFSDVSAQSPYNNYIGAVYSLGLMNGVSASSFCPDDNVTREQLITVLVRVYEKLCGETRRADLSMFYDSGEISDWAVESVGKGLYVGILNGTPNNTIVPAAYATRAEACTMLYRALNGVLSQSEIF